MVITEQQLAHILLVEDDTALATMVADALRTSGHTVWHVERADEAEAALDHLRPDLIVLDLMLPDRNGLLMCTKLKARTGVPLLICSATKRKDDPALGLQLGADDFLRKPFTLDELQARIALALRRASSNRSPDHKNRPDGTQIVGALTVDDTRFQASMGGNVLQLTPTEFRLLSILASRPTEVVARDELAERIWGYIDEGVIRSLDVHMRRLRSKLAAGGSSPRLVTRRGFGYQLVADALD